MEYTRFNFNRLCPALALTNKLKKAIIIMTLNLYIEWSKI